MKSQVGPGSKKLSSLLDFTKWFSKEEITVVGFFKKDSDLKKSFLNVADKLREKISFAHSEEDEVLNEQKVESV